MSTCFAKERFLFLIITLIPLILFTWHLQDTLFLNWDVGHLLIATESMLSGGQYARDYFMPNPPMILYIYTPVIVMQHLLGMSTVLAFRLYIILLSLISLYVCLCLLNSIISIKDNKIFYVLSFFLIVTLFIVPVYEFGQRDCLLYLFAMPYFLAVAYQLADGSLGRSRLMVIGLMAGIGFAIKPQFMITPIMIELYIIYKRRNIFAWLRPEVFVIGAVLSAHLVAIFCFHRNYYTIIMPFVLNNYYASIGTSWRMVLITNPSALFYLVLMFYGIEYGRGAYQILRTILMLAAVSFFIIYAAQRTQFYYHQVAFFSVSLLVLSLLIYEAVTNTEIHYKKYMLLGLLGAATACYYLKFQNQLWTMIVFDLRVFYGSILAIFVFLAILIPKNKSLKHGICCVFIMVATTYIFSELVRTSELYMHQFSLTLFMLILLLTLTASYLKANIGHAVFTNVIAASLLSIPCLAIYQYYNASLTYRLTVLDKLMGVIQQIPGKQSLYAFSQSTIYTSPLVFYSNAALAQRFDCLWMAIPLAQRIYDQGDQKTREFIQHNHEPYFFINMIAADFNKNKPKLVIIDNSRNNILFKTNGQHHVKFHIDYLSYFLENERFKQEWSHYHYLTTLESNSYLNYQLLIYQRGA